MRRSWVEINLEQFDRNVLAVRNALGSDTEPILVVKADAYGHGLSRMAARAASCGIRWFAVAYIDEGVEARVSAPDADILILGAAMADDVAALAEHRLTAVIVYEEQARILSDEAVRQGVSLKVHLKVDTGMGRFGVPWASAADTFRRMDALPGIEVTGVCTHFASVEIGRPSLGPTQMERFLEVRDAIRQSADHPIFFHASSSRAFLYFEEWDLDGIRPGIILYGYGTGKPDMRIETRPVLQWKTTVMMVKDVPANFAVGYYSSYTTRVPTRIATIAAGYADGYHRLLSNRGMVLFEGNAYPVIGRISMNWITVDIGADGTMKPGDTVTLMGVDGDVAFWADDMAKQARTIPYEILTSIHTSAERVYHG